MSSGNVNYLQTNGPATADERPFDVTTADRTDGLRRYKISGSPGDGASMDGPTTCVYYLDEHDQEDVV